MIVSDLKSLPNIGVRLDTLLKKAGINTHQQLKTLGSVETVLRITGGKPLIGYNMLYAIEGAIRGVRWHGIPKDELRLLREQYDRRQSDLSKDGAR